MSNSTFFDTAKQSFLQIVSHAKNVTEEAYGEIQKIDFAGYAKQADDFVNTTAKSIFTDAPLYTPYVTASISGIFAARGMIGLIHPNSKYSIVTNLALSAISGGLFYAEKVENFSAISNIFLVSAFASAIYFGNTNPKYLRSTRIVRQPAQEIYVPSNRIKQPPQLPKECIDETVRIANLRAAKAVEKAQRQVQKATEKITSRDYATTYHSSNNNSYTVNGTKMPSGAYTTVNGVTRAMTSEEEGRFHTTMSNAFGPGSAFARAFGPVST